jgi:hypothetical protein
VSRQPVAFLPIASKGVKLKKPGPVLSRFEHGAPTVLLQSIPFRLQTRLGSDRRPTLQTIPNKRPTLIWQLLRRRRVDGFKPLCGGRARS